MVCECGRVLTCPFREVQRRPAEHAFHGVENDVFVLGGLPLEREETVDGFGGPAELAPHPLAGRGVRFFDVFDRATESVGKDRDLFPGGEGFAAGEFVRRAFVARRREGERRDRGDVPDVDQRGRRVAFGDVHGVLVADRAEPGEPVVHEGAGPQDRPGRPGFADRLLGFGVGARDRIRLSEVDTGGGQLDQVGGASLGGGPRDRRFPVGAVSLRQHEHAVRAVEQRGQVRGVQVALDGFGARVDPGFRRVAGQGADGGAGVEEGGDEGAADLAGGADDEDHLGSPSGGAGRGGVRTP